MTEIFANPENFTPEKLEGLIHETLKFFNDLRTQLASPDEKVREEAMKAANALKTQLEEQAATLCQSVGMDPEMLATYINTPNHFSTDEWQAIEKAKDELNEYQKEIATASKDRAAEPQTKSSKKKPDVNERLMG